jgi:hypothetical protein
MVRNFDIRNKGLYGQGGAEPSSAVAQRGDSTQGWRSHKGSNTEADIPCDEGCCGTKSAGWEILASEFQSLGIEAFLAISKMKDTLASCHRA